MLVRYSVSVLSASSADCSVAAKTRNKRSSGIGLPSMPSINMSPTSKDKEHKEKKKKKGFFSKALISAPSSFKHIAHMGFDSEKGFTAENVDPSWEKLLTQLQGMGISKSQIEENKDFIKDFVRDAEAGQSSTVPPPPPAAAAPRGKRKQAPPAPQSRTNASADDLAPSAPNVPPPPPPPPSSGSAAASRPSAPPPPPPREPETTELCLCMLADSGSLHSNIECSEQTFCCSTSAST